MDTAASSEKSPRQWVRGLRPFGWWLLLVLVLFGIRAHQRLMDTTRLHFSITLEGRALYPEATVTLDGKPAFSDQIIPLGSHQFMASHPKGETFTTNLFIWYGEHNLGNISLERGRGVITISANPPAKVIEIRGPELSLKLTNSSGVTTNVPTDRYAVMAYFEHCQDQREIIVQPLNSLPCIFAPRVASMELKCNQSGASFQVLNNREQLVEAGELPAMIRELPEGNYQVIAWHHGNETRRTFYVNAPVTNRLEVEFKYGTALLETDPAGASIMTTDGREIGVTPLRVPDIPTGRWQVQLRLYGYETVSSVLDIAADSTNSFHTNLVNVNYSHAISATRQFLASGDYDSALTTVGDALQAKPDNPEAIALQKEASGKRHIRKAEALGKQGDYIGADKELGLALQSLPDNEEARQLFADFKAREPEQLRVTEKVARRSRPKEELAKLMAEEKGAELFQMQEIKTEKPAAAIAASLPALLSGLRWKLAVTYTNAPTPDVTTMIIKEGETQFARVCYLAIGQVADGETQIDFKIMEYVNTSPAKDSIVALLNFRGTRDYQLLHPATGGWSQDQSFQIQQGVQIMTAVIQRAIGKSQ